MVRRKAVSSATRALRCAPRYLPGESESPRSARRGALMRRAGRGRAGPSALPASLPAVNKNLSCGGADHGLA
eukprot:6987248-Prymnesium_polylepis.1